MEKVRTQNTADYNEYILTRLDMLEHLRIMQAGNILAFLNSSPTGFTVLTWMSRNGAEKKALTASIYKGSFELELYTIATGFPPKAQKFADWFDYLDNR